MRHRLHVACLTSVALLLTICPAASGADSFTVVHAGQLLAVPGSAPVARQSIVINQKKIVSIADGFVGAADLGVEQTEVRIVDLSESFVMPGLIDSHVHLASSPDPASLSEGVLRTEADLTLIASRHARIALQAGFTTVVDLGAFGVPGHENAIFAVRDAVNAGKLAGPRVLATGTPIVATGMERSTHYRDAVNTIIDRRSSCDGARDCRRAVRHQVKRGSDIIVFFNTGSLLASEQVPQAMTGDEMRAIVEAAHSLGRKAIADGHHAAGIAAAVRAGADIIDSAHLYDTSTFAHLKGRVFLQSHIYGVVNSVGDTPETLHDGLWGWLPSSILLRLQEIRLRPFIIIEAYDRGIRNLAYATDAGVYNWGENAGDLVEFVKRGMSNQDALTTATVNAARMLGLDAELGSIEPGKMADIIATAGNPLDDIGEMLRIRFVMRNGIVYKSETETRPFTDPDSAVSSP